MCLFLCALTDFSGQPQPVLLNIGAIAKKNSLMLYKSRLFGPTWCVYLCLVCV